MTNNTISIEAVQVTNTEQVELLRQIRNATASGFSNDDSEISPQAQRAWWVVMHPQIRVWLYYQDSKLVGFGMLRRGEKGRWWNSLAVLPAYHGRGLGSAITADLLDRHVRIGEPLYSSVRKDNLPAIAMHHADQWVWIDGPDERLVYFKSREVT